MQRRLVLSAWAMALTQLAHGFIPSGVDEDSGGYTGLVVGLLLLITSFVVVYGASTAKAWAPRLAVLTGSAVAIGFVLYHAVPISSPVSNPYPGKGASVAGYAGVLIAVVAAAWCAWEGNRSPAPAATASAAAA